jgi:hypothetical protein
MRVQHVNAVIANGQTASSAISLSDNALDFSCFVGFYTPATLTGTSFTFQASSDGSTFVNVLNEGTSYSVTVAASRYVSVEPAVFAGVRFIKIVSGSSEGAERTIVACLREVH